MREVRSDPDAGPGGCLDEDTLLGLVEGRLGGAERARAARHVDACEECRVVVATLARDSITEAPVSAASLPGALGARFRLLRELESDALGRRFAAEDLTAREIVGLRWLVPELARRPGVAGALGALVLEMRAIDYPHIARWRSVEQDGETLVVTGDLVDGETLAEVIPRAGLGDGQALDAVIQLVSALAVAHRRSLAHGDIRPDNVVLDLAGHVSLTDFGLAGAIAGRSPRATPEAKRSDAVALSRVALALLRGMGRDHGELRVLFKRCVDGATELASAVELELGVRLTLGEISADATDGKLRWIPAPGELVAGRYRVEGLIGSGGMSIVLAARQLDLDRRVALKLMPPRAARKRSAVERFVREARAISSIESEHVARVYDVGACEDGTPYMAMEYLAGNTLGRLLRKRGPLAVDQALSYVLQACVTVAECHARGIIHRDLKPDNIMVLEQPGQQGFVKVLDFGISKTDWIDQRSNPSLTATADMLGTPTYMSPEQVRSSKDVGRGTDIWSLGVMLYELLTGQTPFSGDSVPSMAASIVSDTPRPPRELRPDLPVALERIILRCLEKNRALRPSSIRELAMLLAPLAPASAQVSLGRIAEINPGSVRPPPSRSSHPPPSQPSHPPPSRSSHPPPSRSSHPPPPRSSHPPPLPVALAPPRPRQPSAPEARSDASSDDWIRYLEQRKVRLRYGLAVAAALTIAIVVAIGLLSSEDSGESEIVPIVDSSSGALGAPGAPSASPPSVHSERARPGSAERPSTPARGRGSPLEGRF